jgi:flagellar capping protein FliD
MKINFFPSRNNWIKNEFTNVKNEISNLKGEITNINNRLNHLENKIETKFLILDHDLNEIKIILKSIEKNKA